MTEENQHPESDRSAPSGRPDAAGSALVNASDKKKLLAIGKKMDALLKQADELFYDARDLIGFEERDGDSYTELPDYWEDAGKALVQYAEKAKAEWKREEAIERINAEMKALGITRSMLAGQNTQTQTTPDLKP